MANSIEIEIIANFKDNASEQVKELNAELDKLEKRNVNVSVDIADRMMKDIESKLSQSIDSSGITKAVDVANERAEKILNAGNEMRLTADTTDFNSKIDGSKHKIDALNHSMQNMAVPPGFWTDFATESDKRAYAEGTIGIGALVDFGAINPNAIDPNMIPESQKRFYQLMMTPSTPAYPVPEMYATEEDRLAAERESSYVSTSNYGYDQDAIKYIENYANPPNPPELSTPQIESTGMEQGADVTSTYLNSLGEGMKSVTSKVASRFMGARMLYKGINDAASDFSAAFEADNNLDSQRSIARGATKAGLMGTGAVLGSLVGMPMLGAGAGALISNLFGDQIADAFSGIHKSAEELKNDRFDELFGNIAMSADELTSVTRNLLGSTQQRIAELHQQSFTTGYSMQDNLFSEYGGIWELGSKLQLKNNLLIKNTDADLKAFQSQVSSYMDDVTDTIAQEMYNAFMNNDDLFGYGNWDTSALSEKYTNLFKDVTEQADGLSEYLKKALSDSELTTDEVDYINGVIHATQGRVTQELPDEGQINTSTYSFLAKNGMLSRDSYGELLNNIQTDYMNETFDLANERSLAIANGRSEKDANDAFWKNKRLTAEKYGQTLLDYTYDIFGEDYNIALSAAWNDGKWGHAGLNSSIYNEDSIYSQRARLAFQESEKYQASLGTDYLYSAGHAGINLSDAKQEIIGAFDNVDPVQQEIFGDIFANMQSIRDQYTSEAQAIATQGGDISSYIPVLEGMYRIGALGGDISAKEKYAALMMSNDKDIVEAFNNIGGVEGYSLGKEYDDMWELVNGSNNSVTDVVRNQAEEAQKALENSAQKIADIAVDGTEKQKAALEQSSEGTAQVAADGTGNIVDLVTNNTDKFESATQDITDRANELGQNILEAVSESLDNIDADMLGESNIGEKLMNSIEESLSADNMDFGEMSIGQSILEGISSSLDRVDFGEIDIASKIMDGINASIEAADISGVIDPIKTDLDALNEIECKPNIEAEDNASSVISSVSKAISDLDGKSAKVTIDIQQNGSLPSGFHFASGTPYAPEGLAIVNDDGTSDPRELIEHNGQFMMYDGRDVIVPLSQGDRVFTSAQTKDILSGRGIPHFAKGINNEVIASNREMIGSGSGGASVSIDGLNININIDGNSNGNIVEEIRQRSGEIAEIVTSEIERHLSASFANSTGGD